MQEKIYNPYVFTDAENRENAKALAQKLQEKLSTEKQFASVKSEFKSKLDRIEAEIGELSVKVESGEETRTYFCDVELNEEKKIRIYRDANTGVFIRNEPFHSEDYQVNMELN